MASGDDTRIKPEEGHKPLKDMVDIAYIASLRGLTKVEKNIKRGGGSFVSVYSQLESSFTVLFHLTKNGRGMAEEQYKDLIAKINHWLYNSLPIKRFVGGNKKIVVENLKLVREWHTIIRSKDVIKP
jgi:hypothetical protein